MASVAAILSLTSFTVAAMATAGLAQEVPAALRYFTDIALSTQDGAEVKLYSDLLQGKVVVINTFFTKCENSCPVMAANFAAIQEHFADRMGKSLFLLSFSVDPVADTPAVLKSYAARFHAKPGWLLITGTKANVDFALSKLGQKVEHKEDHMNLILIGNDKTGLWKKVLGVAPRDTLFAAVQSVLDDTGGSN
jgi:protein SCO1/2